MESKRSREQLNMILGSMRRSVARVMEWRKWVGVHCSSAARAAVYL